MSFRSRSASEDRLVKIEFVGCGRVGDLRAPPRIRVKLCGDKKSSGRMNEGREEGALCS